MMFGDAERKAYHNAATFKRPVLTIGASLPSAKPCEEPAIAGAQYGQSHQVIVKPGSFWRERFIVIPRRLTSGRLAFMEYVWQRGHEYAEWEM